MNQQLVKPFLSIVDTSRLTGLSQFSLRKRVREGSIRFTKSGNKVYINIADLLRREGLTLADLETAEQIEEAQT